MTGDPPQYYYPYQPYYPYYYPPVVPTYELTWTNTSNPALEERVAKLEKALQALVDALSALSPSGEKAS